jgi:crotonobetainyl-CoA:carnitine CoA-transferase CaiB-like acyl-CoA transferase
MGENHSGERRESGSHEGGPWQTGEAAARAPGRPGALEGVRILDLTSGIAGPVGLMLLAEQGADVIKVEPPGGDPLRSMPGSHVWHRSRRSVVLDLSDPGDRDRFAGLLATADVLAESFSPGTMASLGLSYEDLRRRYPRLVYASVPAYPAASRNAARPGYDALVQARAGLQSEQPGWRDGPIFLHFPAPSMAACFLLACGITSALIARQSTGKGQHVETSLYQGALAYTTMIWQEASRPAPGQYAMLAKTNPPGVHQTSLYECADGWAHVATMNGLVPKRTVQEVAGLEAPDPASVWTATHQQRHEAELRLRSAVRRLKRDEFVAGLNEANLGAEAVIPMHEAYAHPQLIANRMVAEVDDPDLGRTVQTGIPLSLSLNPGRITGGRPRPGQDDDELLGDSHASAEPPEVTASGVEPKLSNALGGLVVLDLGQYLAGPFGPMILSDLGADVIKVEPVTGDAMRMAVAPFVGCQRGKRSIAIDLRKPEGLDLLYKLVARADVVHHNMTKGTAARLGVDYETLKKYKPDLVYCNTYAYGEDGPLSHSGGLDPLYQASCGLEYEAGPVQAGNQPLYIRMGMCDTGTAFLSVLGVLLALYRRRIDGVGQSVTTSLLNAGALFSSDSFLTPGGRSDVAPLDADQTGTGALYRLYRTYDGWIQLAAVGPGHFELLCKTLGRAELSADPRFSTAEKRRRNRATLENELVPLFSAKTSQELSLALDRAGVPNEIPVDTRSGETFLHDEENLRLGLAVVYDHPILGQLRQFGLLVNFSDTPGRVAGPPPMVGEHSLEILEWIGIDTHGASRLNADGVVRWPGDSSDYPWSC